MPEPLLGSRNKPTQMKIAVIDDDPLVLRFVGEALKRRLEVQSIMLFATASEAEILLEQHPVDIALVDLHLRGESGVESIARISARKTARTIIAFTVSDECRDMDRALRAGADGYLIKGECLDGLAEQIVARGVKATKPLLSRTVMRHVMDRLRFGEAQGSDGTRLTAAERRILELTVEGMTCKEIAERLFISVATVYVHNRRILKKLGVRSRVAATARFRTMMSQSSASSGSQRDWPPGLGSETP